MASNFTQEYLKSILSYDPETGFFTWKERQDVKMPPQWNGKFAGKKAGNRCKQKRTSYSYIKVKGKLYLAHRLAWFYMTGSFPEPGLDIDHIDGNGLNNRFDNLRLATRSQNLANSRLSKRNLLGIKGVRRVGNRFRAQIAVRGKYKHLGYFDTPQEASAAYQKAAIKHHGDFGRIR